MANVTEGLEKPDAAENVNTASGFEAALAKKGVEPDAGDQLATETSVASGLVTVEPDQARDPGNGQFVPAAPETSQAEPDTSNEQTLAVVTEDPEVQAFLAKYDGDPVKALKAATEAASLVGRQGNELGKTREELAELRGRLDALQAASASAATPALSDDQVEDVATQKVGTLGYQQAATEAANASLANGDERLYRAIFEQWNLEDPFAAQTHIADFRAWQREQAAQAAAPAADPWVESQKSQQGIDGTVATLAAEFGDTWAAIAPHMIPALEQVPKQVAAMIADPDPETRLAGARIVADRATILAGAQGASPNGAAEEQKTDPATARKLAGAAVATGALRPPAPPAAAPQDKDAAIKSFKDQIVAAETTSVASGLTFGK